MYSVMAKIVYTINTRTPTNHADRPLFVTYSVRSAKRQSFQLLPPLWQALPQIIFIMPHPKSLSIPASLRDAGLTRATLRRRVNNCNSNNCATGSA